MPLVAVVPATSNSGGQAVRSLLSGSLPSKCKVRAGVRSAEKASEFFKDVQGHPDFEVTAGVDASRVDSVLPVFDGADYAVIVTPHDPAKGMDDDAKLTANMISAAQVCGVKHIVYVGSWTVKAPEEIKTIAARFVPSEQLLRHLADAGGPRFTSLRAGFFFQNYMAWGAGVKAGSVKWPNIPIPAVDPRDVGRVAAAILASEDPSKHHGQCYEISGPQVRTTSEVIKVLAAKLGKPITYEEVGAHTLTFLPPFLQELFNYLCQAGEGAVPFSDDTLKLCGQHTTLETWLEDGFLERFKA